jgi:hypothetical protein
MASKSFKQPKMGDIVLYVDRNDGMIAPAIVTQVLQVGVVLTTFQPGTVPFPVYGGPIPYDFDASRAKGTWHWPEKTL